MKMRLSTVVIDRNTTPVIRGAFTGINGLPKASILQCYSRPFVSILTGRLFFFEKLHMKSLHTRRHDDSFFAGVNSSNGVSRCCLYFSRGRGFEGCLICVK